MDRSHEFDLLSYLERIGAAPGRKPDLDTLKDLHVRHLSRIPFENIDVWLGRPGALDLDSLQAKLVRSGRGGYCFEQNTLFAAALGEIGFNVQTLEARVRPPGATTTLPRTHMVLHVEIDSEPFAADVGFGGDGPLFPVPLNGRPDDQPGGTYRINREPGGPYVMQLSTGDTWRDLYAFKLDPALPVDYEVAHHYTSTYPRSPFVQTLTVQRSEPGVRHILRGRTYTMRRGGEEQIRELRDEELGSLLAEAFTLRLDAGLLREMLERLSHP